MPLTWSAPLRCDRLRHCSSIIGGFILVLALAGCVSNSPVNPSFAITYDQAKVALDQMHEQTLPLRRPVIVLGGIHDPGFAPSHVADVIRDSVPDEDRSRIVDIAFFETGTFDSCVKKLLRTMDKRLPGGDDRSTLEVDVVAFSMGGLVARYAASDTSLERHGRRLRISRLFTIASPHQGAKLASLPTFDQRVKNMRHESVFLAMLNAEARREDYPLFAYVRLDDAVVGARNAALPGATAWWVPSGLTLAHVLAAHDKRILVDILRRLRYQEPFTSSPPAALPD